MVRRIVRALAGLSLVAVTVGCGGADPGGRTTIELFQFKAEAIETFDRIIADFEREHPTIRVRQNHVPAAETALRTRLVREDVPDVMVLNGNATFGELARAKVFHDFADDPAVPTVSPAILDLLRGLGTGAEGEVNGLPIAASANGVIYNRDLFATHSIAVPTTWAELIAAAEKLRAAGVTPFYLTLQDAWTTLPAFNALASNLAPADFFDRLRADQTSFADGYRPVAERLVQLAGYAQPDRNSRDYNAGNQAFAKGEAAMYLQGSWAIPVIRTFKPDFELGTFALPTDDPAATRLVSGVDVLVTTGRGSAHRSEVAAFVRYLMRPEVVAGYAREQSAVPTLTGTLPEDPALAELLPYLREGRLLPFADQFVPAAIPLGPINQQFLIDGDQARYLRSLDQEWDKVARRQR